MIFSDNVTLDDEIRLKRRARDKGLLVMGPDCGTAMIANTPLAFANVMPEGNIGVIGASGTGIQELCSQIVPVVALFLGFPLPLRVRKTSGLPRRWMKLPGWHVYCLA